MECQPVQSSKRFHLGLARTFVEADFLPSAEAAKSDLCHHIHAMHAVCWLHLLLDQVMIVVSFIYHSIHILSYTYIAYIFIYIDARFEQTPINEARRCAQDSARYDLNAACFAAATPEEVPPTMRPVTPTVAQNGAPCASQENR